MHSVDRRALDLSARQHGAFARWQFSDLPLFDRVAHERSSDGWWNHAERGVFVLAGAPPDPERRLWVGWLAVGDDAVVSHECAAERHGLGPVPTGRLVFTTHHGDHHRIPGVTVHQLRDLLPHHITELGGLPITTPPRTIVDLAAVSHLERLSRILENGVNEKLTTDEDVGLVLADVARQGKWGMNRMATALARRAPGEPVGDTILEGLLLGSVRGASLHDPIPQYPHPGRQPGRGRVDFAYPEAKLILEADGRRWHQRIADLKRDRARDNEAARAGWLTLRFMWEELRNDPIDVGRTIAETLAHRLSEGSALRPA